MRVFSFQPSALPPSASSELPASPSRKTKNVHFFGQPAFSPDSTIFSAYNTYYLRYCQLPFWPPILHRDVPPPIVRDGSLRATTDSSCTLTYQTCLFPLTFDGDSGNDADLELHRSHGHHNCCAFSLTLRHVWSRRRGLVAGLRRSPARCWGRLTHARAGLRTARPPGGTSWEHQHRRGEAAAVTGDEGPGKLFVAGAAVPLSRRKQPGRGRGGALDGFSWGGGRTGRSYLGARKVSTYCRLRGLSVEWTASCDRKATRLESSACIRTQEKSSLRVVSLSGCFRFQRSMPPPRRLSPRRLEFYSVTSFCRRHR